jgi:hypothetical protein
MGFPTNESTRNMNETSSNPDVSHAGTDGTPGPNHEGPSLFGVGNC